MPTVITPEDDYRVRTPVAFLVFNRPDTTLRVFAEIAKARPKRLLVVADGPRKNREGESESCATVRSIIEKVDWECEILKNYSDVNLGCKRRVSSGLNWVFSTVDRAIVLEDDVLPHPSFFRYCDELLDRYADDERIGAICGCNFQDGMERSRWSYYFSRYNHVWGWSSWARAWKHYDVDIRLWPKVRDGGYLKSIIRSEGCLDFWNMLFQMVYEGKIDTWDIQWMFSCWTNNMLAVLPRVNLIANIGFGDGATHTSNPSEGVANLPVEDLCFPLIHPAIVMRDELADSYTDEKWGWSRCIKGSTDNCDSQLGNSSNVMYDDLSFACKDGKSGGAGITESSTNDCDAQLGGCSCARAWITKVRELSYLVKAGELRLILNKTRNYLKRQLKDKGAE
jgi:hypothetical protein